MDYYIKYSYKFYYMEELKLSIYVIGDTHRTKNVSKLLNIDCLTTNDYVIITGDFGIIMPDLNVELLNELEKKDFTILYCDGNHEGFEVLNSYPIEIWNGGKIHRIGKNVFHLMRGQVFTIEGEKIFTFGGAETVDKLNRTIGIDWWKEEIPSYDEMNEALKNLKNNNYKVDYVISHDCRTYTLHYLCSKYDFCPNENVVNEFLEYIYSILDFKHWYFGHYHLDIPNIYNKETVVFNNLIKIN